MKIAIDAGHGKYTSGKRCLKSLDPNETREWTLNQRIASKVVEILTLSGQKAFRTDDVTGEIDVPLAGRCSAANSKKADAFISIHHDAGLNGKSGGGATVYVCASASTKSKTLQNKIYDAYIAAGGIKGNRANPLNTAEYYVLKHTSMPAVLIECGFMDSPTDVPIILTDEFAYKAALGIANGIGNAMGFTVKAADEESKKHWAQKCLDSLVDKGVISDKEQWSAFDDSLSTITVGQLLALIDKATN